MCKISATVGLHSSVCVLIRHPTKSAHTHFEIPSSVCANVPLKVNFLEEAAAGLVEVHIQAWVYEHAGRHVDVPQKHAAAAHHADAHAVQDDSRVLPRCHSVGVGALQLCQHRVAGVAPYGEHAVHALVYMCVWGLSFHSDKPPAACQFLPHPPLCSPSEVLLVTFYETTRKVDCDAGPTPRGLPHTSVVQSLGDGAPQ